MARVQPASDFLSQWHALERWDRRQLRRLVRIGQVPEEPDRRQLAAGYARHQADQPLWRWFWVWFPVAALVAAGAAATIHPILVGIVLAVAVNGLLAYRNVRKAARFSTLH